jgi:antitoxin MazE
MAKTHLATWRNSMAVRIPKPVAEAAELRPGDVLELAVESPGAVSLRKPSRKPALGDLLKRICADNLHKETDWGEPAGNELW